MGDCLNHFIVEISDCSLGLCSLERRWSIRWLWVGVALVAILLGARRVYLVFDVATISTGVIVMVPSAGATGEGLLGLPKSASYVDRGCGT